MKKSYNKVSVNMLNMTVESSIMTASSLKTENAEHTEGGVPGGNGGDGLARGNNAAAGLDLL